MTDRFDLDRFVAAQAETYAQALAEIRAGAKRSHWMWFIFPQSEGLGRSETARRFAIRSLDEAAAYLAHPVLGPRYRECVAALAALEDPDPVAVFGQIDALKLRSSLTLFAQAPPQDPAFTAEIARWFPVQGEDPATSALLCKA